MGLKVIKKILVGKGVGYHVKSSLKGKNSKIIRGALNKTQFREQSESLFLTSGFTYQTAEQAEAIF